MTTAVIPEPVVEPVAETVPVVETPVVAAETPVVDPAAPPAAPITYELSLPENAVLDAGATERTVAFARERGLSNEAANAALHLANTEVAAARSQLLQDHAPGGAAWTTQVESWKKDTLADPALGKTPEERSAAIQKGVGIVGKYTAAHPDQAESFTGFFDKSGLGNHPAVVRFFRWLGESASEGSLVTSQVGGDGKKSDVDVFYGSKG